MLQDQFDGTMSCNMMNGVTVTGTPLPIACFCSMKLQCEVSV